MAGILSEAVAAASALATGPFDRNFEPPYSSLQVGVIRGGQAVNVIPDFCTADLEARAIAGISPAGLLEPVRAALAQLELQGFETRWELLSEYPALSLAAGSPLAILLEELTGQEPLAAVSYGTEAGLYQAAGMDAIICGPGDIARAHRPDEYIEPAELAACRTIIEDLGSRLRA
jgi:acetylornithine deacetylase